MKKIGIIAKNIPRAHGAVRKLSKWLSARGKKVLLDERTASDLGMAGVAAKDLPSLVDMVIVLGGDGTLLSAARLVAEGRDPAAEKQHARHRMVTDRVEDLAIWRSEVAFDPQRTSRPGPALNLRQKHA